MFASGIYAIILYSFRPLVTSRPGMAQTANALDIEQIVFFQFPQQFLIFWTVKILARLLVHIDILIRD